MSANALVLALLLSCSSLAVMALNIMEEPARDLLMRAKVDLTITNVNWKTEPNTTTLQLCTVEEIPEGQTILVWGAADGSGTASAEEKGDDNKSTCSTFSMDLSFKLSDTPTLYQLIVEGDSQTELAAKGSITFAMTAQTFDLKCGEGLLVTKLSWTKDSPISYTGECITPAIPFESDCYLKQSFSNSDICFTVNGGAVTVCLNGPIGEIPSNDQLSVNYLAYGPPAVLSLNYATDDMTNLRAIVRLADDPGNPGQPGLATVYECPVGFCTLVDGTEPVNGTYEVCAEASGTSLTTAATKIIDLNLVGFVGGTSIIEFVFVNGLASKKYTAILYDTPPPYGPDTISLGSISVDCEEVEANHLCFGFFSNAFTGTAYIALSERDDTSNTIIANTVIEMHP